MIIDNTILIDIKKRNYTFYKNLGYDANIGSKLEISINDLPKGSNLKINVKCDYCGFVKSLSYYNYNKSMKVSNKYACSQKCSYVKKSEILMDVSGIKNIFQSEYIKDKIKETNTNKYGCDEYIKSDDFIKKSKETLLQRYGVDNYAKTPDWKIQAKETSDEKYGGIGFQSKTLCEKISKTNFDRYGFEIPAISDEIKKRISESIIEKYGKKHVNLNEDFRKVNFKVAQHTNYIEFNESVGLSVFQCDYGENHTFKISSDLFSSRTNGNVKLCTVCNNINQHESHKENELKKYIESINVKTEKRRFDNKEIDIYIKELNLGFEFNGIYWHSDVYKEKNYHINKTNYFKSIGIRVIHIWEDDWDDRKHIIKSQIKNLLNQSIRIGARKCVLMDVTNKQANEFYNENHIQGSYSGIKKSIGLYYEDELVCLMSFDKSEGRIKMLGDEWNLSRYCSKINHSIQGGASKMFKYFINNYKPTRVISYADNDWSDGGLYKKLGFVEIKKSKPDYKYIVGGKRVHKSRFKKSITGVSESKLNIPKIYDTGKLKYEILLP